MTEMFPNEIVIRRGPSGGKTETPIVVPQELKLVPQDHPALLAPCAPAPTGLRFRQENESLIECMLKVCEANRGFGLSANQLGVSRQLFILYMVYGDPKQDFAFFNPKILERSTEYVKMEEGCLSLPYIEHQVSRPTWVILSWFDIEGFEKRATFHGITARVICHEMDHMEGRTLFDHMSAFEIRRAKERQSKKFRIAKRYNKEI